MCRRYVRWALEPTTFAMQRFRSFTTSFTVSLTSADARISLKPASFPRWPVARLNSSPVILPLCSTLRFQYVLFANRRDS